MQPKITHLEKKKLVGMSCKMSFSQNKIKELWQGFMPVVGHIQNRIGSDLYSAEIYDPAFFKQFDPDREFEKWAAVEVTDFDDVPDGMETFEFPGGLYAAFLHKGPASTAQITYQHIYREWIPNSEYSLDDKPHVAVMGESYNPTGQESAEQIWIPVKK